MAISEALGRERELAAAPEAAEPVAAPEAAEAAAR
jgi:hypothetical protein